MDCRAQKNGHYKKIEKAERAVEGDKVGLVLCLLMSACNKIIKKKKVWFVNDVK